MEVVTPKGVLKYRNPTVLENFEFMNSAKKYFSDNDAIGAKVALIRNMGPLIDYSGIDGISSYDDLLGLGDEMTLPLGQVADEVLQKVTKAFSKKP